MFSNLQILFSDQKGIHETSAHLWIEGLFQIIDQLKGLRLVALKWLQDFLSVREEFANPRKHVVQLFEKKSEYLFSCHIWYIIYLDFSILKI